MARFYPHVAFDGSPHSELTVRDKLATLDDDWRVFHSVVWQAVRAGKQGDGEADFVLLHPAHGMVVLEVKGGRIEVSGGEWYSTDRKGVRHRIKDPFRQAKDSKYALLEYLRGLYPRLQAVPRICHAVVFPDVSIGEPIGVFPREIILDASDLNQAESSLKSLLAHWEQYGRSPSTPNAVQLIADRLAPTLQVQRRLRADLADSEREILTLTARQFDVLRHLRSIRRCVVRGGAGTGKTLLAMAKARSMAADGARVLLCCYNAPLADRVASDLCDSDVSVATFHAFCLRSAKAAGVALPQKPSDDWWDREAPRLLEAAASKRVPRFDALVVDEAQDFAPSWIGALDALSTAPNQSPFYMFTDSHQQLYRRGAAMPSAWPTAELDLNCRNTLPIARMVAAVYGDEIPTSGAQGRNPILLKCDPGEEATLVQSVVDRLLSDEGLAPSQIAVLCERRELADQMNVLIAGGYSFVPIGSSGVLTETVHRFKGLEADVVVLALSTHHPDEAILYVGMSRARSMLVVVGPGSTTDRLRSLSSVFSIPSQEPIPPKECRPI
jgi:hypothetical protein